MALGSRHEALAFHLESTRPFLAWLIGLGQSAAGNVRHFPVTCPCSTLVNREGASYCDGAVPENETSPGRLDRLVADVRAEECPPTSERNQPEQNRNAHGSAADGPYRPGGIIADRYRLVRELGRGGMGVVWVAHSLVLGVDVALKLIRVHAAGSAAAMRMAREAHAAARIGHPALVHVFDFGWTHRGDPYLVMELVQGETLSARLARVSPIPAIRAVQTILPVADGLRVAHGKSIVHRDIKPDNIFLASDTFGRVQPKLLDFGIAKVGPTVSVNRLTGDGVVMGSPEYMSPEQAFGLEEVDERTDVWSLAVVLYEMVTGRVPFRGANYNALMQNIVSESPVPMPEGDTMDVELWRVVERGLAKQREMRWASMAEFGTALAVWLDGHGVTEDVSGNSTGAVWLEMSSKRTADLRPIEKAPHRADEPDPGASTAVTDQPESARQRPDETASPESSEAAGRLRSRRVILAAAVLACGAGLAVWAVRCASEPRSTSGGAMKLGSPLRSHASARQAADSVQPAFAVPTYASVQSTPDAGAVPPDVQNSAAANGLRRVRTKGTRSNSGRRTPGYDFGF
jgi:serine/threonine protein kinase